jgi:hypothetical protein
LESASGEARALFAKSFSSLAASRIARPIAAKMPSRLMDKEALRGVQQIVRRMYVEHLQPNLVGNDANSTH